MTFLVLAAGLVLLIVGAELLVRGASRAAAAVSISPLVVGLTVVAFGTSSPELAVSIGSSLAGQGDLALGNVVGSNVFNLLGVLGVAAVVSPAALPVSGAVLRFDLPVMTAVAVACLPIFFTGHRIDRWEGGVFLFYYVAYTGYLVLAAARHEALGTIREAMLWFVIPLTVVTLLVFVVRSVRSGRAAS